MSTKLGIFGDLHFRGTVPVERVDDYLTIQYMKAEQALIHFHKEGVKAVIAPGDVFHNYGRDSYAVLYEVTNLIQKYSIPFYVVRGQHDIRFHKLDVTDTPMQILIKTGLVTLLHKEPTIIKDVYLFGASFGEHLFSLPEENGRVNIMVMHKMIINGKPLYPGQTDYTKASNLQNKYKFDLYVCGDNHNGFVNGKVINCGSLMRMSIDQAKHTPFYGIYDCSNKQIKTYKYTIEDASKVLKNFDGVNNTKHLDKLRKEQFATILSHGYVGSTDYRKNVNQILRSVRRVKKRTREIVGEALDHGNSCRNSD